MCAIHRHLAASPYTYVTKLQELGQVTGSVDHDAGNVAQSMTLTIVDTTLKFELTVVGADYYVKYPGVPGAADKWVRFDPAKVPSLNGMFLSTVKDPTGLQVVTKAVVTATRAGDKITGTVDLTKVGDNLAGVAAEDVPKMGDKAKALPFEATLDGSGRITALKYEVPAYGTDEAQPVTIEYKAVGTPVTVAKPAANKTVEATPEMYKVFNG